METQEQIERRLAEIEASLKATTRAPWHCCDIDGDWAGIYAGADDDVIGRVETEDVGEVETEDNGAFMVEAHNDFVPYLLAKVRELLPALAVARAAVRFAAASERLSKADYPQEIRDARADLNAAARENDAALARFADAEGGRR